MNAGRAGAGLLLWGGAVAFLLACPGPAASTGEYANLPLSVRQSGMGDVGARDVLGAWSNPAVLGFQSTRWAVAFGGGSMAGGDQALLGAAASWLAMPGVALAGLASGSTRKERTSGAAGRPAGPRTWSGGLAFAFRAGDPLSAGVTVKSVSDRTAAGPVSGGAFDAGLEASVAGFRAGLAIRNLGRPLLGGSGLNVGREHLASETRLGACYTYRRIMAGAQYAKLDGADGRIGLGAQLRVAAPLAVRAGVSGLASDTTSITAGLTLVLNGTYVDYAYATDDAGATHRMAVSYLFGKAPSGPVATATPTEKLTAILPAKRSAAAGPARTPGVAVSAAPKPAAVTRGPGTTAASPGALPSTGVAATPRVEATRKAPGVPASGTPADSEAEYQAAKAMMKAGRNAEARKKLEALTARDPANWKAWALLGNACYATADTPAALGAWDKSLELKPDNAALKSWVDKVRQKK